MKFNWGTGIVLAILAFVGFIMYFFIIKQYEGKGIDLIFPNKTKDKMVIGLVKLYRPSDEKKDFVIPITGLNNQQIINIPDEKLLPGRWDISVEYSVDEKDYSTSFKIKY